MSRSSSELVRGWLDAARRPEVAADLVAVFAEVAEEVERRAPACWASGRCCNFKQTGHLLFVTGLEAAYTLERCGSPGRARLDAALKAGGCPFQVLNLCGVHGDKPLGCRLYFCDRTSFVWQNDVYERLLGKIRALHTRHGVEYRYGEWRGLLAEVMEHGVLGAWPGGAGGTGLTVEGV